MNNKNLGERIREQREDKDIKQKDLAEFLKIEKNTMSQYESLKRLPDYITIKQICVYLNVSADYLIGISDVARPIIDDNLNNLIDIYISCTENNKNKILDLLKECEKNDYK